jgi:hypothetical protein
MITNKTNAKFLNELVTKVLRKSIGINNEVIIDDWDLDRIYLKINNNEHTIRMWNIFNNGKNAVKVQWTLFKIIDKIEEFSLLFFLFISPRLICIIDTLLCVYFPNI